MAFSETAPLIAALKLDDKFSGPLKNAGKALGSFDAKLDHTQTRAFRAGQQIGTGIKNTARLAVAGVGILASQVALGLQSLIKLEDQTAQTEAVIKSTGGAAGVAAGEVRRLAEQYESLNATVGDETIQNAENLLLTFTNVRKQAFEPALKAALDMNQALGGGEAGLAGTMKLLGKALQDPEKGLSRLGRAVGGFSDETTAAVKEALKQNDVLRAQNIIIAELEKRYGGSFARAGDTVRGKIAKFTDSIEDLQRALAEALLPTLGNVADALTKTLADPQVVSGVRDFGKALAGVISPANLASAGAILQDVFSAAREAAPVVLQAAKAMGSIVGAAVSVFKTLPPEIQKLAIGAFAINKLTGGLVTNVAGGLIGAVLKQFKAGLVNVSGGVVNVNGGIGGGVPGVAPAASKLSRIASLATKVFIVGAAIGVFAELKGILDDQAKENRATEAGQQKQLADFIAIGNRDALVQSLAGLQKEFDRLTNGLDPESLAFQLDIDGVRDTLIDQMTQLRAAIAKLPQADKESRDRAALIKAKPPLSPEDRESSRNATSQIRARSMAKFGRAPSETAVQNTLARNIERAAAAQKAATDKVREAVTAADTHSELAGIRNAIGSQKPPTTNVKVTVNVTAAQVSKSVVIQKRFGPPGGSRESDAGHIGGAGT